MPSDVCPRSVVASSQTETLQLQGNDDSKISLHSFPTLSGGEASVSPFRQSSGSIISEPTGRHQEQVPNGRSGTSITVGRKQCEEFDSSICQGTAECDGGFSQSARGASRRVGTKYSNIPQDLRKMGYPTGGSYGHSWEQESSNIYLQIPGDSGQGGRRTFEHMGLSTSLCLSPSPYDYSSSEETAEGASYSNSNSPILATETLVSNNTATSSRYTLDATEGTEPAGSGSSKTSEPKLLQFSGLVVETNHLNRQGFSEKVVDTLMRARKASTSRTYYRVWKTFLYWSQRNGVDPAAVSTKQILDFLQAGVDKGLACSSIKVQVAALSIMLDRKLVRNKFISRFLQAVRRMKPVFRHPLAPWDLNLVLQQLTESPFEPLQKADLKFITWKVCFLVAITSARRISELQALWSEEPFLNFFQDKVVLRTNPSFLPKVVSQFHVNQEISLPSLCPNPKNSKEARLHTLDLVRALRVYLQKTKDFRATKQLFVLLEGKNKGGPASKASIARWVKSCILKTYEMRGLPPPKTLKAHSTRAIATSWAGKEAASIQELCKAAGWSSPHTFTKHYKVDVQASADARFGRRVLSAVV